MQLYLFLKMDLKKFKNSSPRIKVIQKMLRDLSKSLTQHRKNVNADVKRAMKLASKGKRKTTRRKSSKPSGIQAPQLISTEMAVFLNQEVGAELSRVEVAKLIHKYMNDNELKYPNNKRYVRCDEALIELLVFTDDDQVTDEAILEKVEADKDDVVIDGHKIQAYIKTHFQKKVEPETEEA